MTAEHGGRVYEFARAFGRDMDDVRDFSAGINPFGPPPFVLRAIAEALPRIRHYPDESHAAVKQALSERLAVPRQRLVCGNGATEAMELTVRALAPRRVLLFEPAFSEYAAIARRCGAAVRSLDLRVDARATAADLPVPDDVEEGDLVIVNNPHNPTGVRWTSEQWGSAAMKWERRGAFTLFDESFIDFLEDAAECTALQGGEPSSRRIVVRSLTKMYTIPGLRFGYAVVPVAVAQRVEDNRDPWSVNVLAQAAAVAALQEGFGFERGTRERMREERAYVQGAWGMHRDVVLYAPTANFFLIRLSPSCAERVLQGAAAQGALLRDCASFSGLGKGHLRIAIRRREDNVWLWEIVRNLLDTCVDN